MQTATLEGIVQGVVVQIIKEIAPSPAKLKTFFTSFKLLSSSLKPTSIDFETLF